jgi:hypothetical protein
MREVYSNFDDVTRMMHRRTSHNDKIEIFCDSRVFVLSVFFWLKHVLCFFFLLLLLLLLFACITHYTRCVKTALLSLSLSSLKKSNKEHEKIVHETLIELITHHNKKKRTERSLFTLSLSLSFFFQKRISCFPAWFLPKRCEEEFFSSSLSLFCSSF